MSAVSGRRSQGVPSGLWPSGVTGDAGRAPATMIRRSHARSRCKQAARWAAPAEFMRPVAGEPFPLFPEVKLQVHARALC
jgi:hypothetical protein